jgi:hypothetical protein
MSRSFDWYIIGYSQAMRQCTGAEGSITYPTQDKYSPSDEADYIRGFNEGMRDYQQGGYQPIIAYAQERFS